MNYYEYRSALFLVSAKEMLSLVLRAATHYILWVSTFHILKPRHLYKTLQVAVTSPYGHKKCDSIGENRITAWLGLMLEEHN